MAGRRSPGMQGRFIPKNPSKYVGNVNRIMFRSSWELSVFQRIDKNPAVVRWSSEEFSIPYLSPLDMKVHKYFPDITVAYKTAAGTLKTEIIEIKPFQQSVATPGMSDRDKQALLVNDAKWKAAAIFAEKNNATFRVLTEKTIFRQGPKRQKAAPKVKMPKLAKGASK